MNLKIIGIDLAKQVFQVCALSECNKVRFNKALPRAQLLDFLRQHEPTIVAMEACASAHFWAREIAQLGHEIRLVPAQHTKAFARVGKTDAKDALAICEAALRPNIHFVPPKTVAQQDLMLLHSTREAFIQQRTATMNRLRSVAGEYGFALPKSQTKCLCALTAALEDADNDLSFVARHVLHQAVEQWRNLSVQLADIEKQLKQVSKQNDAYTKLQTVPGIGPIIASTFIASVGNGAAFAKGRHVSAWAGLVPRQQGSGGKTQLHGITKNGNRYLRKQLVHGARIVVSWAIRKPVDNPMGRWLRHLVNTRGKNKAVVAYANKMARVAWALVHYDQTFDMNKAFAH